MATEVVVVCDVCLAAGDQKRASRVETVIPTMGRSVVIDLCDAHRAELVDPLVKVLLEFGRDVDTDRPVRQAAGRGRARAAQTDGSTCPVCGKTDLIRLDAHIRKHHREEFFKRFPPEDVLRCPVCGVLFAKPQGLAAHMRVAHPETHSYVGDVDQVTG